MLFRLVYGFVLLIFSCKDISILPPHQESIDTDPPIIKWISPRFDAVVNEVVAVTCQVTDKSSIDKVELWADDVQKDIINVSVDDSIYTLDWHITNYNNGDEPLLFINHLIPKKI